MSNHCLLYIFLDTDAAASRALCVHNKVLGHGEQNFNGTCE